MRKFKLTFFSHNSDEKRETKTISCADYELTLNASKDEYPTVYTFYNYNEVGSNFVVLQIDFGDVFYLEEIK